jgi:hypothetical protein
MELPAQVLSSGLDGPSPLTLAIEAVEIESVQSSCKN